MRLAFTHSTNPPERNAKEKSRKKEIRKTKEMLFIRVEGGFKSKF